MIRSLTRGVLDIKPNAGEGELKTTFETKWNFANSSATIYAGYCYWRKLLDTPAATPNAYIGLNGKGWINHEGSDGKSYGEINGEAWVATVSTAGVTAAEQLGLFFSTSSSGTGPRFFVVEWATSEDGPFTEVGRYEVTNWDALYYPPEFYFALPDECAGHDTLVVRCRVWKRPALRPDIDLYHRRLGNQPYVCFLSPSEPSKRVRR